METSELSMHDISISFPGVNALKHVSFATETGLAHALVGANGAGKSTLMKVLSGVYDHYTGSITLNGREIVIRSPAASKAFGIGTVYQEVDTALIPYLSAAENIMLDVLVNDMKGRHLVNWKKINSSAREILELLKVEIDVRKTVDQLTLAQKQIVLIAQALAMECRFLILDEPTAPLSHTDTEKLFSVVKDLLKRNIGVIFISHRLPEVMEICDRITVLRDGEFVAENRIRDMTINSIVELMLGRGFDENYPKLPAETGKEIFRVHGLGDGEKVHDVDMYVRSGEIVGVAGLVGAGKTELCKALFGASRVTYTEAVLKGRPHSIRTAHASVKKGLALVPEERRKEGILLEESVATNLTASSLSSFCGGLGFIHFRAEKKAGRNMIGALDIKTPGPEQRVALLSGGNQQKVAVGKWLVADADVYIFDEPTKGVDVGAKRDIFELIGNLAAQGKGIIYASCELAEIMGISDRVYVMYNGTIVKELKTVQTSEQELLFYSTGGK